MYILKAYSQKNRFNLLTDKKSLEGNDIEKSPQDDRGIGMRERKRKTRKVFSENYKHCKGVVIAGLK